ncbi:hypothetical protein, no similarity [Maudiozyma saulgeensis]|uniref:Uncharacterized protein n=1 Tax=Maudiozyma saulgeensis TaxID=1789683 RepID=A0A1X7R766_9SACH|nr:hypothetical protein, no similarity [Kazachstania saulgeensis]
MFGFLSFLLSLHLKIAKTYDRKQTTQKNSIFATLYNHGEPTNQTLQFTFPDSRFNLDKEIIEPDIILYIQLWPFLCMILIMSFIWFIYKQTKRHQNRKIHLNNEIITTTTTKMFTHELPAAPVSLLIWKHQLPLLSSFHELEELETFTTALPSRGGGLE